MKYFKIILTPFLFSFVIFGCQKTEIEVKSEDDLRSKSLSSFIDFQKMISQQTDGKIAIQSFAGLGSQNEGRNYSLDGYFDVGESNSGRTSLPEVKVGGMRLTEDGSSGRTLTSTDYEEISSFYGRTIKVDIGEFYGNGRTSAVSYDFYVPKLISINNSLESIRVGENISWNFDGRNTNGVAIKIEYKPQTQRLESIAKSNPEPIIDGFMIPDNGSIEITNEMLKYFPNGSDVLVTFARANIQYLQNDNSDEIYTVGGITSVQTRSKIVK